MAKVSHGTICLIIILKDPCIKYPTIFSLIDTQQSDNSVCKKNTNNGRFNVILLRNWIFILICLANAFGSLGYYVPYVFQSDMAELTGITKENSDWLLSIIGIV